MTLLLFFWMSLDPQAQLSDYVHRVWRARDGLPQNSVHKMIQTKDGYLWLATQEGLVRFDGVTFKVFDRRNVPILENHTITAFYEDKRGRLWFGNRAGQIIYYEDHQFHEVPYQGNKAPIRAIGGNGRGGIFIGTMGRGVFTLEGEEFQPFTPRVGNDRITSILNVGDDLWIGTDGGGIARFDGKHWQFLTSGDGLSGDHISDMIESFDGSIWIGTELNGLNHYKDGNITVYRKEDGLAGNEVRALYEDRSHQLWIGTLGNGISLYHQGKFHNYTKQGDLSSLVVDSILEDHEGNLWVGTVGGGLNRYSNSRFHNYTRADGLQDSLIWYTVSDKQGGFWFCSEMRITYLSSEGKVTNVTKKVMGRNEYITAASGDSAGNLWVGTDGGGLFKYDPHLDKAYNNETLAFPNKHIRSILVEDTGQAHIGTYDAGLFSLIDGKFVPFSTEQGLPDNFVSDICRDHEGNLWVATSNQLCRFEKDGTLKIFSESDGLETPQMVRLVSGSDGSMWMGTDRAGLIRYKNGTFRSYTKKDGFFDSTIYQIIEDDNGNLWFTSNFGIFKYRLSDFNQFDADPSFQMIPEHYDMQDGMASMECHFGGASSGIKDKNGVLWIPTAMGVVTLDPSKIVLIDMPPSLVIERLVYLPDHMLSQDALKSGAVLPPSSRNFEFHYTALSFFAPKSMKFRYILENYDSEWIEAGSRRVAYYSDLPAGKYTFKVIGCNGDGVWNKNPVSFEFELRPRFYQHPAFYTLVILASIGMISAFHFGRIRIHQSEQRELEVTVAERTHELALMNDDLLLVNRQLAESARLAGMSDIATDVLHNIGNALNSALTSVNLMSQHLNDVATIRLIERIRQLLEKEKEQLGAFIQHDSRGQYLPDALQNLSEVLTTFRKDTKHEIQLFEKQMGHIKGIVVNQKAMEKRDRTLVEADINMLIEDVLQIQAHVLRKYRVELIEDLGILPLVPVYKSDFLQIITNLIKNACEAIHMGFGENPRELLIKTIDLGKGVRVEIRDSGVGISKEGLEKLFSYGFTTKKDGHGFGLHYCANVIEEMGGTLRVHSDGENLGTSFFIELSYGTTEEGEA